MSEYLENARVLQAKLAEIGIRVFRVTVRGPVGTNTDWWLHQDRTSNEFRADIESFLASPSNAPAENYGWSGGRLNGHLPEIGYCEPDDVLADTWEGQIAAYHAELLHGGHEDECPTEGFGHFGWESKD